MRVLVKIRNSYERIQLRNRRNGSAIPGIPPAPESSFRPSAPIILPSQSGFERFRFLEASGFGFGTAPLDILASNINMIGFNVSPFLKLFYELAPFLLGRNGREDMPANHSDAFAQLANDARSRIREITPEELAKLKQLPLIVDVREKDEYSKGHIRGAKHISRGVLEQKILESLPTVPVQFWCIARAETGVPWLPIISRRWAIKMCSR